MALHCLIAVKSVPLVKVSLFPAGEVFPHSGQPDRLAQDSSLVDMVLPHSDMAWVGVEGVEVGVGERPPRKHPHTPLEHRDIRMHKIC